MSDFKCELANDEFVTEYEKLFMILDELSFHFRILLKAGPTK